MRLKLLLFSMLLSVGSLFAQDTIRTLIFTESHAYRADQSYVELTNVGTKAVQLSQFKLGHIGPWTTGPFNGQEMQLPNKMLDPGKSFVIATFRDYNPEMYRIDPDHWSERITQAEYWDFADLQIHVSESNPAGAKTDSVTPVVSEILTTWGGRDGFYLEQHLSEIDSVVVDQVGGVFDNTNGLNYDKAYDVAGVTGATGNSILVRKAVVKKGNIDFANARGVGADDSEWIVIPLPFNDLHPWRAAFWTPGNHGDYNLDANTLVSNKVAVDFANKTMTAQWGIRNFDDFAKAFTKKPGIAWHYDLSTAREDSAYNSARTGDKITFYACGNDVDVATFAITVAPPAADANIVMSKYRTRADGKYDRNIARGNTEAYKITVNAPGMDTITNSLFGIGYATRVDTLLKYLEKAPKANWELMWIDGIQRSDVKNGDILKVTAENGSVKKYFIKVNVYKPSHNAYLSSITWPDIPEELRGIYGWKGDTIPNFVATSYNYKIQVPIDVSGIPALIAKTEQLNAKVSVKRATSLTGTLEQNTITFTVTAQDGYTQRVYTVELIKELNPDEIQPFNAEPFLSELVFQDMWGNGFVEIANPGTEVLDLSNYMLVFAKAPSPASAITSFSALGDWGVRYQKYVPGYKWVDEAKWGVTPGILVQDLNVSPYVYPQDVFVGGQATSTWGWNASFPGPVANKQVDVFLNTALNPWGEKYDNWASAVHSWCDNEFYLFKILNDSVKAGLKPANDPNDFQIIDVFGMGDGTNWNIGGYADMGGPQCMTFIRKPTYWKGKPAYKESFGTNQDNTEWYRYDPTYWEARGTYWPNNILNDTKDLGQHFMNSVTDYKSTIASTVYKVSNGYSVKETIKGMKTGTKVSEFMANIIKKNDNQSLKVKSVANGAEKPMDAVLALNDTLVVMSADGLNKTKYILNVNADGLSSDAVLTSKRYVVTIEKQPKSAGNENAGVGNIKGFEYGTNLKTILAGITAPAGARIDVINGQGAYVSLLALNFDSTYVNVTVNDNTYISVLAENGITEIVYQLIPSVSDNDAFITSNIYEVVQKDVLVNFVPRGTTVQTLLSNIFASTGASIKIMDKMGHQRIDGSVADDDKIVVTSKNGMYSKAYYLAMLAEQYIPETTYLAYILSNVYAVDQVVFKVDNVSGAETISKFLSNVKPSDGATAVVVNKDKVVKTTGDINGDDMVQVTSADGKMMVYYTFGPLTSTKTIDASGIEMYPNPTNDEINVSGVKAGYRIQVYNVVGAVIRDINVQNSVERISLRNQPIGMYMVVVSDNNKTISRFKAVKQ